jgi:hypothetical protein
MTRVRLWNVEGLAASVREGVGEPGFAFIDRAMAITDGRPRGLAPRHMPM